MIRLIVVASYNEARKILRLNPNAQKFMVKGYEAWRINDNCYFSVLGIGKVTFAIGVQSMIDYFLPNIIYSIGFAGAVGRSLKVFDKVIVRETYQYDVISSKEFFSTNSNVETRRLRHYYTEKFLLDTILENNSFRNIKPVIMVTGDNFLKQWEIIDDKREYVAADQETCSLYQVCFFNNIPCVTLKIITDACDEKSFEIYEENVEEAGQHLLKLYENLLDLEVKGKW